jgi:peptidoglycan hydrolase CwlO-like protein
MNKLLIVLIVAMILAIIGFVLSGVVNATAQEGISQNNSTIMDNQEIILN